MMLSAVLLLAAATSVPPGPRPSPALQQIAQQADAAREANRIEEAVQLYRRGVRLNPSWAEGWWYLGSLLYDQDRYVDARASLQRLVALTPPMGPGWALLGLCEYQLKEYAAARQHLMRAEMLGVGDNPQFSEVARYHLATLDSRFQEFEASLRRLLELAREAKERPELIDAIGIAALRLPYLPSELPAGKKEVVEQVGRAEFDLANRKTAEARQELEALTARYPRTSEIHYLYGSSLLTDRPDEGRKELEREVEVTPQHVPARVLLALEAIKRSEPEAGLAYAEQAVKLAPGNFVAHNALGRIYVGLDRIPDGIRELELARKLAPNSPETRFALASAYARVGRTEDAARERSAFQQLDSLRSKQKR